MKVYLTSHQIQIARRAAANFRKMIPSPCVEPIFRGDGANISVSLAFTEEGHHYIVRETIKWYSSDQTVWAACQRLVDELGRTYANATKSPN